ncbi:MAG: 30S ribosomal protein S4 [Candidatus Nanoarchaeia archaeon]
MIRKSKKYSRPRRLYDKARIDEENKLVEKYGLKNKKEIWKADSAISEIRNSAKKLITKPEEEKSAFINRLQKQGFSVASLPEVLGLNKEDWLKRRLQTIVYTKKLSFTPKQARQLIAHRHITINGKVVNIPSYQVSSEEESKIICSIALKIKTPKKSEMKKIEEEVTGE